MTQVLAQICRHPIKGHGRETLASVRLLAGACMPWDRHWAVAHDAAKLVAGWNPCVNFARAAKAPAAAVAKPAAKPRAAKATPAAAKPAAKPFNVAQISKHPRRPKAQHRKALGTKRSAPRAG